MIRALYQWYYFVSRRRKRGSPWPKYRIWNTARFRSSTELAKFNERSGKTMRAEI